MTLRAIARRGLRPWSRTRLERIDTILGRVRRCTSCGEDWPVDEEFFYFDRRNGNVLGPCRACWSERRKVS